VRPRRRPRRRWHRAKAVDKARIESFVRDRRRRAAPTVYVGQGRPRNGSRTALAPAGRRRAGLPFDRIELVMGDTATTPDQWLTGASTTIAQGGMELRRACATARAALLARGAARLGVAADDAGCRDGVVFAKAEPTRRVGYGELAASAPLELAVDPKVVLKKPADYQWIGKPIPRVDIPAS
jgi:CO/xanthine dehydrogenase Mo-binding subunit